MKESLGLQQTCLAKQLKHHCVHKGSLFKEDMVLLFFISACGQTAWWVQELHVIRKNLVLYSPLKVVQFFLDIQLCQENKSGTARSQVTLRYPGSETFIIK